MSTEYHTVLVVGVEIDKSKVFKKTLVRGCRHSIDSLTPGHFCARCGNKIWINGIEIIPEYEDEHEITLAGIPVFSDDDNLMVVGHRSITIGFYTDQGTSGMMPQGADNDQYKEKLRQKLEPLGLWDKDKFGTWIIMWCS